MRLLSSSRCTVCAVAGVALLCWLQGVSAQTGTFNLAPGQLRQQTFRVLEFEYGTINQRFEGTLRYYCTFRGKWNKWRMPNNFPRTPSWSPPIFISHSDGYQMWSGSVDATLGVESIAEVSGLLFLVVVGGAGASTGPSTGPSTGAIPTLLLYWYYMLLLCICIILSASALLTCSLPFTHTYTHKPFFVDRKDLLPSLPMNSIMLVSKRSC